MVEMKKRYTRLLQTHQTYGADADVDEDTDDDDDCADAWNMNSWV